MLDCVTAYAYELRTSANRTELKADTFHTVEPLPVVAVSKPAGQSMELTLDWSHRCDRAQYVAARAVDHDGNKGRVSNVMRVLVPCPPTTTTVWPSTLASHNGQSAYGDSNGLNNGSSSPPQWFSGNGLSTVHWAAIVASSCVAILILILVVYFVVDARRRKDKEQSQTNKPKFAFVAPVTANAGLYPANDKDKCASLSQHHNYNHNHNHNHNQTEKGEMRMDGADSMKAPAVIYGDGKTVPVHWSASQLLQEHERRHSPYGQHENDLQYQQQQQQGNNDAMYSAGAPNGSYSHPYGGGGGGGSHHDSLVFSGSYHLNTASATYGHNSDETATINIYSSNGTASTTPPSESLVSIANESNHGGDYRPYSIDYEVSSSMEHDGYSVQPKSASRPPTLPKSDPYARLAPRLSHLPLHGSFTSLASERKKRNVTQV